jgi:hypothetical protein
MRAVFENVIKLRNEDPLLPETWYNLASRDMQQVKVRNFVHIKYVVKFSLERQYSGAQIQRLRERSTKPIP